MKHGYDTVLIYDCYHTSSILKYCPNTIFQQNSCQIDVANRIMKSIELLGHGIFYYLHYTENDLSIYIIPLQ